MLTNAGAALRTSAGKAPPLNDRLAGACTTGPLGARHRKQSVTLSIAFVIADSAQ